MDRRAGVIAACVVGAAACSASPHMRVVSRGTLAYAAAWGGPRLVTIELTERFELVVRDGPRLGVAWRLDLGPPQHDLPALAVAGNVALVGGVDGFIRRIDLVKRREIERWPQGAPITALAADADHVVVGDTTGVVCLRRATGELLQCTTQGSSASIDSLAVEGARVTVRAGRGAARLAIPSLAASVEPVPPVAWRGAPIARDGRAVKWRGRTLVRFGDRVRAVAPSPDGRLAIAGWVRKLDQPSVIVWTAPP